MSEVGIVIVTHNSADHVGSCLDSAAALDVEVVVVDNASEDRSAEVARAHKVRVIANPENRGFAAAVNQGVRALATPYVLLLNPDAVLRSGLDALTARLRDPQIGAAGGKLVDRDSAPQRGFNVRRFPTPLALIFEILGVNRIWPGNPVNWHYRCFGMTLAEATAVDQPAGAFLMFSRAAWETVGGFEEGFYPVWFEDVDFCRRLRDAGYRIWFEPDAVACHYGAHSVGALPLERKHLYWYRSLLKYAARHFSSVEYRVVCAALVLGSLMRLITDGLNRRSFTNSAVYGSIARLAAGSFWGLGSAKAGRVW